MKTTIVLFFVTMSFINLAQITTTKVKEIDKVPVQLTYDSLVNFVGESSDFYLGQQLYLKGKAESLQEYGYENFMTDFKFDGYYGYDKTAYKCCAGYKNSKYEELAGKYFDVIGVDQYPRDEKMHELIYKERFGHLSILKLVEIISKDTLYYEYTSKYEHSFPFIVVGYYEKQQQLLTGEKFVIRGENWMGDGEMTDIETGKPVNFTAGTTWKCLELTIEEKYYTLSLLVQNDLGEKIPLGIDNIDNDYWVFPYKDAIKFKQKFGNTNWQKILKRKIAIGFTEQMAILSWGQPNEINESSYRDQWVYDDQYLYFVNGKLTAFN